MELMLKGKRIAFPALAEAEAVGEGGDDNKGKAWSGRLVIEPTDADVLVLDKVMLDVAKQKWKDDGESIFNMLKANKKVCFEHGPYCSTKTGKVYGGFEGMFNLGMRTAEDKARPTVFDKYGRRIGDPSKAYTPAEKSEIRRLIYSGCYVNAKVDIWAQDNSFGRGIRCSVLGVMFAKDGESFGGGAPPASEEDFASMAADPMADAEAESVL